MDPGRERALARVRALSSTTGAPWTSLGPRALLRTGRSARDRWQRLRSRGWQIAQCAVAAALAWYVATTALGHERPFFAPVAAVLALGMSFGGRLRRVVEVVVGVAVGVAVGDLFVSVAGTGVWQIALVVAVAMGLAVLLDGGGLIVTQAGVQGVIVTTLLPVPDAGFGRWLDAVVGGTVALAIAALVPASPLRRPRLLAAACVCEVADLLAEAARSARDVDVQRAARALERARASQPAIDSLRAASQEGLGAVRGSPFRRRHRTGLLDVDSLTEPLDRAVRNVRVLLRRVAVTTWRGETVPPDLVALLDQLAAAAGQLGEDLSQDRSTDDALTTLRAVAAGSGEIPVGRSLTADVVLAQLRSITVDLMQVSGLDLDQALAALPPERAGSG